MRNRLAIIYIIETAPKTINALKGLKDEGHQMRTKVQFLVIPS